MTDTSATTQQPLERAVLEIERVLAGEGWDQPARLYALVDTAALIAQEPSLAGQLGAAETVEGASFTSIEQDALPADQSLESVLETIAWPDSVTGCAAALERLVLPTDGEADVPDDPAAAEAFVRDHPDRQEMRIVAAATRDGATYCALRMREHDDELSVLTGDALVPGLLELLQQTLDLSDPPRTPHSDQETQ